MAVKSLNKLDAIIIFFAGLIFFTLGLWNQEIIGFESRFYLFAMEMTRHGLSWFPTTYQVPYPDYPVASTALIYLTAKLFGALNKCIAVFPSAMAAALTLSATYLIGSLQERRWGWYSVGFLLLTLAFVEASRTISLDMYVTAVTAWLFYFAYSKTLQKKTPCWWITSLLLITSFAIRGPIGIVIPTGVLTVFYLLEKDWKSWILLSFLSLLLLGLCTIILLGLAYHTGGNHFMQDVLRMQIFGRMEVNRTPPFYFYFVESIGAYAITYPLAILVISATMFQLCKKNSSSQIQFLRLLTGWVIIVMVGLSLPADKKIRYILPLTPALALICSSFLIVSQNKFLNWLKKSFYFFCWVFPLLCLMVLSVLHRQGLDLNYAILSLFFVMMQIIMLLSQRRDTSFFLAVLTFFIANIYIVEKINLDSNRTQRFVKKVEDLREKQHAKLAFYREGRDGLAIKYLANMLQEENPLFIWNLDETKASPVFLIATEENFNGLSEEQKKSLQKLMVGKIGHDKVIVFINIREAHPQDAF